MSTVRLFNLFSLISRRSSRSCKKKKVCDCRKDDRCQNTVFARELVLCTFSAFSAVCSWIQYSEILVCNIEYMKGKFFFFFFLFLFIKLPLPWNNILVVFTMLPFCSLSWLFLPEKHPFVCYFSKYLFNFMFFSSEICISFTLFTLFWVRRLLLFLLPWNYQTISKGCFCFLNLYETLPTLELFVWHCFWFYLICLKPLKCTTN